MGALRNRRVRGLDDVGKGMMLSATHVFAAGVESDLRSLYRGRIVYAGGVLPLVFSAGTFSGLYLRVWVCVSE